ncbi:zinc finger, CCHC-type containing protein [Tanacetum coccineum]
MREISRREGANREGNVSKWRKYLSPSNKSVKTAAEEFLEKASRELLGDNKSSVKGPFKLQDSDEDDDMSAEPIMSGCIKVSVIRCIPAAQHPNVQDILKIRSIMFFSVLVQKHGGSKQVGFKQLGLGVETGVHGVHDEKRVWFEVELQGAQRDREAEVFQVSNDDTAVAQRRLEDKQPEEKTNTDCLVKEQKKEYQTGWKIKTGNVLDSCNQRSTQQCTKSGVAKHLGVAGLQQQNGLVKETNVTLLAKVRCFLIQSGLSKVLWAEDTTMSTYLVNKVKCIFLGYRKGIVGNKLWRLDDVTSKVVLYRNMGFNESGEYKKTFIGSGVGTGSMQVLQGDEFEVEPQDGHTFEVEPHGNVDHVVGSQEVQTQDLIYYHPARDREQHSVWELFSIEKTSTVARNASAVTTTMSITGSIHQGSLSGDCDMEKNGKWSCIYAVGSQEYQMVCMRLDIASADVDQSQAAYMTLTEASKEAIWLKRLAIESGFELKIVADIATGALSKAIPSPRFQHRLTPQLHESAGGLPSLKLSLHSCSLPGSTNAMGIETSIALVLPAREHECDTSFVLGRPPALSSFVHTSTKRCKPLKSDKLGNIPKEISGLQRDAIPMVANRKFTVLRTCLQIDQGTWVIAELSHVSAPYTIERITETVSKVTWVEHMEVDEPLPNRSGFAFGAERMVAWLERSCERWSHMNATCHIKDPEGKG